MTETAAAVIVFETFLEQDGPQDAKTGDDGEKFRMSERQRVRGTAVVSGFASRAEILSQIQLCRCFCRISYSLINPFAYFVHFAVRCRRPSNLFIICHEKDEMIKRLRKTWKSSAAFIATA